MMVSIHIVMVKADMAFSPGARVDHVSSTPTVHTDP
jgi:hypothetical protein